MPLYFIFFKFGLKGRKQLKGNVRMIGIEQNTNTSLEYFQMARGWIFDVKALNSKSCSKIFDLVERMASKVGDVEMLKKVKTAKKTQMELEWKVGLCQAPRTDVHRIWTKDSTAMDFHAWLEDKDGNIIDPTPSAYFGKRHYKPFTKKEQLRLFLIAVNERDLRAKQELVEDPLPRWCLYNAYSYKQLKNRSLKLVIGHLGFEIDNGHIYWAFG